LSSQAAAPSLRVLEGSYYEIGLRMGATLGALEVPEANEETVALALACEALVADTYPAILDKVEGMIDGGGLNGRDFKALFYARDFSPQVGCTNLAVLPSHTVDNSLVVGVNYDWYYYAKEWRELRTVRPKGARASLRVTHHWAGSTGGMNEAGLGVYLSVLPRESSVGPGLAWHLIVDILLDDCRDVEEAKDFVTSVPHLSAFNYLIVDADGAAVVAESLPGGVTMREAENGFLLATNHLPGRETPEENLSPNDRRRQQRSIGRYAKATKVLSETGNSVDEAGIKSLLRDHEAPICRGNHNPPPDAVAFDDVFGTIWSLVAKPQERRMQVAWGHPCRSEYVSHSVS
jgi:predicted choloylglycine hydrolase